MYQSEYYDKVGAYYDEDAPQFEKRYWENQTLQKIRSSFREETEVFQFNNMLEIGSGPGVDLSYFAQKYPQKKVYGIDISEGMVSYSKSQFQKHQLTNIELHVGTVEDLSSLFSDTKFDLIYIYFGALNTVESLSEAADYLKNQLNPGGKIVVTVINKWYFMGMFLPLLKLRFKTAFKRLQKTWGGYSPKRTLESKCYSPSDVRKAFNDLKLLKKRGYSILYPAWYQDTLREKMGKFSNFLWKADRLFNKTPFWSCGEYTLFVFSKDQ